MRLFLLFTCWFFIVACGSGSDSASNNDNIPPDVCSVETLETSLNQQLADVETSVDFTFSVKRADGREYTFSRGNSSLQTFYESASTSKLVSAVVILRLVELGYLALTDNPQDYIESWPIDSHDPLYQMNLAQLLSFTSGLENEALCLNSGTFNFEDCVNNIATRNANNGNTPGESFYYSSSHLQVAGYMAYKAFGVNSWQELFTHFTVQTGLFSQSLFDLPSATNPRLAGGMHWTGEEYLAFLSALKKGEILNSNSMDLLLTDHIENAEVDYSPAFEKLGEDWKYGFGLWHECQSAEFNCVVGERVSSPGSYGAYPYWDRKNDYTGILARQGSLGTFDQGLAIERDVRSTVEDWVDCQ